MSERLNSVSQGLNLVQTEVKDMGKVLGLVKSEVADARNENKKMDEPLALAQNNIRETREEIAILSGSMAMLQVDLLEDIHTRSEILTEVNGINTRLTRIEELFVADELSYNSAYKLA